jgi:hypothetical protein
MSTNDDWNELEPIRSDLPALVYAWMFFHRTFPEAFFACDPDLIADELRQWIPDVTMMEVEKALAVLQATRLIDIISPLDDEPWVRKHGAFHPDACEDDERYCDFIEEPGAVDVHRYDEVHECHSVQHLCDTVEASLGGPLDWVDQELLPAILRPLEQWLRGRKPARESKLAG